MNTKNLPIKILIILTYHIISYLMIHAFNLLLEFANCPIYYEIYSIPQNLLFILVCSICLDWEKKYAKLTWILGQIIYIPTIIWRYPYDDLLKISSELDLGIKPYAVIGTYELVYMILIATPLNVLGILLYYTIQKYYPRIVDKRNK